MKLIKEQESPLLDRKTVYFESMFERNRTPSRVEVKMQLSTILKVKPELIAIKKIQNHYGQNKISITANIYKNTETLRTLETAKKKESAREKKETTEEKKKAREKKEEAKEEENAKETKTKEQSAE